MKRISILIIIAVLFSACKKPSTKAAGVYYGTATYPIIVNNVPQATTSPDTITVTTVDNNDIAIGTRQFSYSGESNGETTFQCSDPGAYHSCFIKFDRSFTNMEYYTSGPGMVAYYDFKGSR
jgi:hypothetical protein